MSSPKKPSTKNLKDDIDASVKLFDVAEPGKTAASTTSRPVIVGHKSMTKRDPMVVDSLQEQPDEPSKMTRSKPLTIKPVTPVEAESAETVKVETPEVGAAPEAEEATVEESAPETSSPAVVENLVKDVTADQSDKKEKHDLELLNEEAEKLIASKQFFVPLGQEHKASSRAGFALIISLLIVALALVVLNFAVDAELITIGVDPLTDVL